MKIGELIKNLCAKAGVDVSAAAIADPKFAEILAMQSDLSDDLANKIETSLLTLDAAAQNSTLKSKIRAEVLNGLDVQHEELMTEFGFDDTLKSDFKKQTNTYERNKAIAKKVAELTAAKSATGDKTDKAAFQKQIDDLNIILKNEKAAFATEKAALQTAHETEVTGLTLTSMLKGRNYAFPKEMNQQAQLDAVQAVLQRELATKGAKIKYEGNGQLKLVNAETSGDYHDEKHTKIDLSTFIDGALAQNKLLAVNAPTPPGGGGKPITVPPGGKTVTDRGFGAALETAMTEAAAHS